jgi:hypothetical protein
MLMKYVSKADMAGMPLNTTSSSTMIRGEFLIWYLFSSSGWSSKY